MQRLAAANGIAYLHFLQPNQYVSGSKPLTERDRAAGSRARRRGAAGRELRAEGVAFYDLARLAADDASLAVAVARRTPR